MLQKLDLTTLLPNEVTYMPTFIGLYIYFTGVEKGKKIKPSEYGNIISVGIAPGATALAHYACTGRCINKADVFTPVILL